MGCIDRRQRFRACALAVIKFYYDARIRNRSLPVCFSTKGAKSGLRGSIIKRLLAIAIPITIGASIMPVTGIADSVFIINFLEKHDIAMGIAEEIANENARVAYTVLRSYVTPLINMPAVLTLSLSMSLVPQSPKPLRARKSALLTPQAERASSLPCLSVHRAQQDCSFSAVR